MGEIIAKISLFAHLYPKRCIGISNAVFEIMSQKESTHGNLHTITRLGHAVL